MAWGLALGVSLSNPDGLVEGLLTTALPHRPRLPEIGLLQVGWQMALLERGGQNGRGSQSFGVNSFGM